MKRLKELVMNRTIQIVVALVVFALGTGGAAHAQKQVTSYQYHYQITQTVVDVCNNNIAVEMTGEYFFEYFQMQQPNGDMHTHWTSHYNLKGVENGVMYVGTDQQTYDLKADPDGFPPQPTSDFHTSDKFKLIAQGPYPKMTIQSFLHVRVSPSGANVTQEKDPVVKCTGKDH
jgi:hypothetical protein